VYDFMDRTIEYRIALHNITDLRTRRHGRLSLQYSFYRDPSRQTGPMTITGTMLEVNFASRHIVDVTEPLVKFLTGNNLMIEIFGWI
jgi:hypothetical protein